VLLLSGIAVACMALVLGKHTPIFHLAWKYLPGMGQFRFPTRFLVVVELALALLGAIGLTSLCADCSRRFATRVPRLAGLLALGVTAGTALDLFANQSHQNPFVPASEWLNPPAAVATLGNDARRARFYAPLHNDLHMQAFRVARGWSNLDPYRLLRATVAPNTGVYWDVPTVDCYAGIAPSWFVDVWGDHSRYGFVVPPLMRYQNGAILTGASYASTLATFGVTHVLSPVPVVSAQLREIPNEDGIHVYEVAGQRVRIIPEARKVDSNREAASFLVQPGFDPDRLLLLHRRKRDEALQQSTAPARSARAQIVSEDSRHVRVDVEAPQGGYLLLADTYYPGWQAQVDGTAATLHRANISLRAVWLPPGAKKVEFVYEATAFFRGIKLASVALVLLLAWVLACARRVRQARFA
jgi:hypothetical protein